MDELETLSEWPHSVIAMAGTWNDFPEAEEIRTGQWQNIDPADAGGINDVDPRLPLNRDKT